MNLSRDLFFYELLPCIASRRNFVRAAKALLSVFSPLRANEIGHLRQLYYFGEDHLLCLAYKDFDNYGFQIFDILQRQVVRTLPLNSSFYGFASSVNKRITIFDGSWFEIMMFDPESKPIMIRTNHIVFSACYSPLGNCIATGSGSGLIEIWDASDGRWLSTWRFPYSHLINCITYSHDGRYIACGSTFKIIAIWDTIENKMLYYFEVGLDEFRPQAIMSIRFTANNRFLLFWANNTVHRWDLKKKKLVAPLMRSGLSIQFLVFSPDGRYFAWTSHNDNDVRLFDVRQRMELYTIEHSCHVTSICFSSNSSHLVLGDNEGVTIWDRKDKRLLETYPIETEEILQVSFGTINI